MKKILAAFGSLWLGPVVSIVAGLSVLAFRTPPPLVEHPSFDYMGAIGPGCLIFGILWLLLYATDQDSRKTTHVIPSRVASDEGDVALLKEEIEARVKEAADFKAALGRKDDELRVLRASLQRADLRSVNEGVAAFFLSAEFLALRIQAGKETPEKALTQLMEAADELLNAACLLKGMPRPGERLSDLPAGTCTVIEKLPAPLPEQKGLLAEVRNSWVGFRSGVQLVVISPSRVSVYV